MVLGALLLSIKKMVIFFLPHIIINPIMRLEVMIMDKEWPEFIPWGEGTCSCCGEENVEVCALSDDYMVCEDCFFNELELCDECGELWDPNYVDFYDDDGRHVCMHCAEELGLIEE